MTKSILLGLEITNRQVPSRSREYHLPSTSLSSPSRTISCFLSWTVVSIFCGLSVSCICKCFVAMNQSFILGISLVENAWLTRQQKRSRWVSNLSVPCRLQQPPPSPLPLHHDDGRVEEWLSSNRWRRVRYTSYKWTHVCLLTAWNNLQLRWFVWRWGEAACVASRGRLCIKIGWLDKATSRDDWKHCYCIVSKVACA